MALWWFPAKRTVPAAALGDKSGELSAGCSCQTLHKAAAMELDHRLAITTASVLQTPSLHRQQPSSRDFQAASFQHRASLEGCEPLFGSACPSTMAEANCSWTWQDCSKVGHASRSQQGAGLAAGGTIIHVRPLCSNIGSSMLEQSADAAAGQHLHQGCGSAVPAGHRGCCLRTPAIMPGDPCAGQGSGCPSNEQAGGEPFQSLVIILAVGVL